MAESFPVADLVKLQGNPLFDAAAKAVGFKSPEASSNLDRLELSRPRYTSNDVTNRGTHGYIKVISGNSAVSPVVSDVLGALTGSKASGYDNFLITGINFSMEEKVQVTEVFGDTVVSYFFGRAPIRLDISGVLIDSPDNSWFSQWITSYSDKFRGSKTAQKHQQLQLILPNMTVTGSMINTTVNQQADNDVALNFRFTLLVTSLTPTAATPIGEGITNAANSINFSVASAFTSQMGINSIGASLTGALNVLKNPTSAIGAIGSALGDLTGGGLSGFSTLTGTSSAVSDFLDSVTSSVQGGLDSLASAFSPITTALSSIRASLFAPIYGVMNSLSKLVGAVFGAAGIFNLLMSLTAPIRNMLGDIKRIAAQALAIANIVSNGISQIGRGFETGFGISNLYKSALQTLHLTFGVISAIPLNLGNSTANLSHSGLISSNAAFLQYNPKKSLSRSASLSGFGGGGRNQSASLSLHGASWSPQKAILAGGIITSSTGAYL